MDCMIAAILLVASVSSEICPLSGAGTTCRAAGICPSSELEVSARRSTSGQISANMRCMEPSTLCPEAMRLAICCRSED